MSLPSSRFRSEGLCTKGLGDGREICSPSRLPPVFISEPSHHHKRDPEREGNGRDITLTLPWLNAYK